MAKLEAEITVKGIRKVKIWDDGLKTLHPEHFWLKVNEDIIAEL